MIAGQVAELRASYRASYDGTIAYMPYLKLFKYATCTLIVDIQIKEKAARHMI